MVLSLLPRPRSRLDVADPRSLGLVRAGEVLRPVDAGVVAVRRANTQHLVVTGQNGIAVTKIGRLIMVQPQIHRLRKGLVGAVAPVLRTPDRSEAGRSDPVCAHRVVRAYMPASLVVL